MSCWSCASVSGLTAGNASPCLISYTQRLQLLSKFLSPSISFLDLPTGWEEGYTFEGARCFIKWVSHTPPQGTPRHNAITCLQHSCHKFRALSLCILSGLQLALIITRNIFIISIVTSSEWKARSNATLFLRACCVLGVHIAEIWNLYSRFLHCKGPTQKLMITREHWATAKRGQSMVASSWELFLFIQTYPAPELTFAELNQNVMCTLFMTFIKLSKKLFSCLIRLIWPTYNLKLHVLGLCLKTFLRHIPTYSIKYVLFNVCVGRRKYNASSMSIKKLWVVHLVPLSVLN